MSEVPLYDALSVDYDRFVHWPERLRGELPFLEAQFRAHGVRRVLDAACGTGQHALALARRGYEAAGADLSPGMIEQARARAAEVGLPVPFQVAPLGGLRAAFAEPFDALLCLGNSLPHVLSPGAVQAALRDFAAVLRPGGVAIIQNRNYDHVWGERERFMPLQAHREGDHEWLFFRFMDFHEATLTFNVVTLQRSSPNEAWSYRVGATELQPLFQREMAGWLPEAGFSAAEFYGSYSGAPFDPELSGDLIVVAERG